MKHRDGGFDGSWELEGGAKLMGLREIDLQKHKLHVKSHQLFLGGLSTTTRFTSLNIFYQKTQSGTKEGGWQDKVNGRG